MEPMNSSRERERIGVEHPAQTLDYIIPIRGAPERRLDPTNLQPFCRPWHYKKTNFCEGGFGCRRRLGDAEE